MNNATATVIKVSEIVAGDIIDFGDGARRYVLSVPERLKTVTKVEFHTGQCIAVKSFRANCKVTRY